MNYESPHDWLSQKAKQYADQNNVTELWALVDALAYRLDADSIQDLFQPEMDADGYFDRRVNDGQT